MLEPYGFPVLGAGAYVIHKALEVKRKEKFPPEKGKRTTFAEKQKIEEALRGFLFFKWVFI